MEPTQPHGQVEHATASSAGGYPDPDGEDSRRGAQRRGMTKQDRGRGRYRYRNRMEAGSDWAMRNRVVQPCCDGAERTRQ
ncbi:MAG: hypothetical protein ACOX52_09445 [Verrucomicrobiota bacterium]